MTALETAAPGAGPLGAGALDPGLAARVAGGGTFDASVCMNCGVCTAVCPMGIPALPRRIMHDAVLGRQEQVLDQVEAIFSCLLCRMCEANCPAGVRITENIRALRRYVDHQVFGL